MLTHITPELTALNASAAVGIAILYILVFSLVREPVRQQYNAIVIAGAGAAYLSGGLGGWEFAFCTLMTFVAYKGLRHYYFIGVGWLLHTAWDVLHHLYGNPIVPFDPASSAGCAVCDSILALWFFAKAPSVFDLLRWKPATNSTLPS